jgi:hypothetical protein
MIDQKLLEILRCPVCIQEKDVPVTLFKDAWLICPSCGRKYPIVDDIPVMLAEQGDRWMQTPEAELLVPPPRVK